MSPIYTRRGDDGTTGILGDERLPKHHPRIEALGTLDEASAALGLARALCPLEATRQLLADLQRDLYAMMAETAADADNAARFRTLTADRLAWLEAQVDALTAQVTVPKEFILPGDTPDGAAFALARTVIRRAERRMAELVSLGMLDGDLLLPYLNRLSSLCFILELQANALGGQGTLTARETGTHR